MKTTHTTEKDGLKVTVTIERGTMENGLMPMGGMSSLVMKPMISPLLKSKKTEKPLLPGILIFST